MTNSIKIKTYNVGTNFGCEAAVKSGRKTLYTTDTYPRGCTDQAREAAESWAAKHGHTV